MESMGMVELAELIGSTELKRSPVVLLERREYYDFRRYVHTRKKRIARAFGVLSGDMRKLVTQDSARAIIRRGKLPAQIRDGWAKLTSGFVTDSVMPEYYHTIDLASEIIVKKMLRVKGGPSAVESAGIWANERGGTLLVDLTAAQMANAQAVIHAQVIWGVTSPHQLAQMMKPMVGLTGRDAKAVGRFYQGLIAEGISPQNAVSRLDRYAKFLHGNRADRIARTELADAYNFGQMNSIRGALDEGLLEGTVEKRWMAGGANPCEICLENEAAGYIKLDASFPSGDDHPTAHPDCECAIGYKVKRTGAGMGADERAKIPGRGPGKMKRGQAGHIAKDYEAAIEKFGTFGPSDEFLESWLKDAYLKATGKTMSNEMAAKMHQSLTSFTGEESSFIRGAQLKMGKQYEKWAELGDLLEDYLKFAPQFDPKTTIYRGVKASGEKYDRIAAMVKKIETGEIKVGQKLNLGTTSHWSTDLTEAHNWDGAIVFETKGVADSTSIMHFSSMIAEAEVMVGKDVGFTISKIVTEKVGPYTNYRVVLVPSGG